MLAYEYFELYGSSVTEKQPEAMIDRLRQNFMQLCGDMRCDLSLYTLLNSMDTGEGSCDLVKLIYESGSFN